MTINKTESNLLNETLDIMGANGLKPKDMVWFGSYDGVYASFDWSEFESLANKKYNNSTLTYRVAYDLIMVFKTDQWMERYHDTTNERWVIHKPPQHKSKKVKNIKSLFGNDNDIDTIHLILKKQK